MRIAAVAGVLGILLACEPVQPCDEYVDYMCDCHANDTGVDCSTLKATYEDADQNVQDECSVLLDEQESADQRAGECATTTTSG